MDSTAAQHHQGSASLPRDYHLVSRYAQHNNHSTSALDEPSSGQIAGSPPTRYSPLSRRLSHPSSPTMGRDPNNTFNKKVAFPSEATPLLSPVLPVPRIEEPIDSDASSGTGPRTKMIWEELPILAKYALPVFG